MQQALAGSVGPHQRFMIAQQLEHIDFLGGAIQELCKEVEKRTIPFEEAVELLDTIPGANRQIAHGILAEIGTDMSRFPTPGHLAYWAGVCPGSNESGGKRKNGKTRKGNEPLRAILPRTAQAASHTKATYLSAQYRRLAGRRGKKRATIAVAHTILVIVHRLLMNNTVNQDLGANYFHQRNSEAVERRLVRRLEAMGNKVTIERIAKAA